MKNKMMFMRTKLLIVFLSLVFISVSCLKDEEESSMEKQVRIDDEALTKYLGDSIQAQKHSSGFYYKVLVANDTGRSLSRGNVVDFTYKISLLNGQLIEESTNVQQFKLLWGSIVPLGLDRGISLMKTGEKFRFYLPSYLAYGDYRNEYIPANSNFIVDVKLTNVHSETDIEVAQLDSIDAYMKAHFPNHEKFASGLYYVDSLTGTGDKPREGNMVVINYTRSYFNGTTIKSAKDVELYLNHREAVQGLEEGIMQMRAGGKAIIMMPASIGFDQAVCVIPNKARQTLAREGLIWTEVKPYSIIQYSVELKSVY